MPRPDDDEVAPPPADPDPLAEDRPPRRASSVIVWDLDRKERPLIDPVEPAGGVGADRGAAPEGRAIVRNERRDPDREPTPQTLAQRRYFLQCLALTIRQHGREAGPHIDMLCREFQIPVPSEVAALNAQFGSSVFLYGRDLEAAVTALRRLGAPEAFLLEQLTEQMARTIGTRRGPRDRMEARVFAARKLLAIPLPEADPFRAVAR